MCLERFTSATNVMFGKEKIYFDACCITFRTALAYGYERDDFERMRFVGIVFRELWDLRAELVPMKDAMTFIVAEMSLRVECGTKGTKARMSSPKDRASSIRLIPTWSGMRRFGNLI